MAGAEGWDWVLVQTEPCPQCGHDPARIALGDVGAAGIVEAHAWRDYLLKASTRELRGRPAPGVWSPMQYAAHVRDMFRVFGDRVIVAVDNDNPSVASFAPTDTEFDAFNDLDPGAVAGEIRAQAERLAAILGGRGPADWDRTVMRDGVDRFTVAGLGRFAVHEAHHHLLDVNGRLGAR